MAQLMNELMLKDNNFSTNIEKAKAKLNGFKQNADGIQGTLNSLSQKLGINISTLTKFGTVAGIAGAGIKGFQEVMSHSQGVADEYNRIMGSVNNVIDGFWRSIAAGSFDGFITGLERLATNARDAYNALDDLSTHQAFYSKQTAEFERKRAEYTKNIRAGINVEENKKALKKLEQEELKYYKKTAQLQKDAGNAELARLTNSELGSGWVKKYYDMNDKGQKAARKEAERLESITKSMAYRQAQQQGKIGTMSDMLGMDFTKVDDKIAALKNYAELTDEELTKVGEYYANAYRAETTYYRKSTKDLNQLKTKTGSSGKSSSSTPTQKSVPEAYSKIDYDLGVIKPKDVNTLGYYIQQVDLLQNKLKDETLTSEKYVEISLKLDKAQQQLELFKQGKLFDIPTIEVEVELKKSGVLSISELFAEQQAAAAQKAEDTKAAWSMVGGLINQAGNALSSFGGEGAKIGVVIAQAIANVVAAYGESLAKDKASKSNVYSFIAAAASATISMAATIAQIHKATGYTNGGIVHGSSSVNDHNIARINDGEMVLNQSQQTKLWRTINDGTNSMTAMPKAEVEFKIKGQTLVGVQKNYYKKQNRL